MRKRGVSYVSFPIKWTVQKQDFRLLPLPVIDLLKQEGLSPIGITITGGHKAEWGGYSYHVPKRD